MLPLRPADLSELEKLTSAINCAAQLAIKAAAQIAHSSNYPSHANRLFFVLKQAQNLTHRVQHLLNAAPLNMKNEAALKNAAQAMEHLAQVTDAAKDAIAQKNRARTSLQHSPVYNENPESPWGALFSLTPTMQPEDSGALSIWATRSTNNLKPRSRSPRENLPNAFMEAAHSHSKGTRSRDLEQLEEVVRTSLENLRKLTLRLDEVLVTAIWAFTSEQKKELMKLEDEARANARRGREALAQSLALQEQLLDAETLSEGVGGAVTVSEAATANCNDSDHMGTQALLPDLQKLQLQLESEFCHFCQLVQLAHDSISQTRNNHTSTVNGDVFQTTSKARNGEIAALTPQSIIQRNCSTEHLTAGPSKCTETYKCLRTSQSSSTPDDRKTFLRDHSDSGLTQLQLMLDYQKREMAVEMNDQIMSVNQNAINVLSEEVNELSHLFSEVAEIVERGGEHANVVASDMMHVANRMTAARHELEVAASRDDGCLIS